MTGRPDRCTRAGCIPLSLLTDGHDLLRRRLGKIVESFLQSDGQQAAFKDVSVEFLNSFLSVCRSVKEDVGCKKWGSETMHSKDPATISTRLEILATINDNGPFHFFSSIILA